MTGYSSGRSLKSSLDSREMVFGVLEVCLMSNIEPYEGPAKSCFFLSPIGSKESPERERSDAVMDVLLNDVLAQFGFRVERADKISELGRIEDQIFDRLISSDLTVCDLTDLNPNVMYELGVRHAIGKPSIVIASEGTRLPFDTASLRTVFYNLESAQTTKEAERSLREILSRIDDPGFALNPVAQRVSRAHLESNTDSVSVALSRLGQQMDEALSLLEDREQSLQDARFAIGNQDYEEALRRYEAYLEEHPFHQEALIGLAKTQKRLNMPRAAVDTLTVLLDRDSDFPNALYNRACYQALLGMSIDTVLSDLKLAIRGASRYRRYAASDPDFAAIKDDPAFQALLEDEGD
jgi:tetratricopeptide (TPR) repeat protein